MKQIMPNGLNLEHLVKSKHLWEANKDVISRILKIGSKQVIEAHIKKWERVKTQKVKEFHKLREDVKEHFSDEQIKDKLRRAKTSGEIFRKKERLGKRK